MPAAHSKHARRRSDRLVVLSLLGVVAGAAGGLVAEVLLLAIYAITNFAFWGRFSWAYIPPDTRPLHVWAILLPAAGGLLVGLIIHFFSPEIKGDGIPAAMSVVLTNSSRVKPRVGIFKPLSAAITIGSGGPFGAEGPIIQTGGALGSILGQLVSTSPAERRILLACGAAAGLAGVFKTPFAGVMMAIELLVFEFRARSFIPIALASATGTLVAIGFRGPEPVFPVANHYHFHAIELPSFLILAVLCAGLAWLMTRTLYACEDFFEHLRIWFPLIPALGGLGVGIIGWFYPQVFGIGYDVIGDFLARSHPLHQLIGVGFAKLGAFGLALGSGASGGTFAPALMIGGSLGAAYGSIVHHILPQASAIGIYGMVATAALFGCIYRATPTAILFLLEVTGAYHALFPLFLVCVVADLAVHYLMDHTINTERLAREGIEVPDAIGIDPMRLLKVRDVLEENAVLESVAPQADLRACLAAATAHDAVPVVDGNDHLLGLIYRADLLQARPDAIAADLARPDFLTATSDEPLHDIAVRLLNSRNQVVVVLEPQKQVPIAMLTPFDLLKGKQWETMQEMREPGRLSLFALARRRNQSLPEDASLEVSE